MKDENVNDFFDPSNFSAINHHQEKNKNVF